MRDELHLMELVDRYLDGGMDASENAAFEERMRESPLLQGQVHDQRALREGLQRVELRAAIASAHRGWVIRRWSPWVVAALVVLGSAYWFTSTTGRSEEHAGSSGPMPIPEAPQAVPALPADTNFVQEELDIQVESVFVRSEVRMQVRRDTGRGEGRVVTHMITAGKSALSSAQEPPVAADGGVETTGMEDASTPSSREYNTMEMWRRDAIADSVRASVQEQKELLARVERLENATKPAFPGGMEEMQRFLDMNVVQPRGSKKAGTVMVGFTVNKKGEVVNVEVVRGLGRSFDAEAIRVVSTMPAWEPSRLGDRPVKSRVEVPVRFPGRGKKESQRESGSAQPQDLVK